MAKLDFEKDRIKRKPKDPCPDAPWRSDHPTSRFVDHRPTSPAASQPKSTAISRQPPQTVEERLREISRELAGPEFCNLAPQMKLEHLAKIQARLNRIVELHGSFISSTQAFRAAEADCRRELKRLDRPGVAKR